MKWSYVIILVIIFISCSSDKKLSVTAALCVEQQYQDIYPPLDSNFFVDEKLTSFAKQNYPTVFKNVEKVSSIEKLKELRKALEVDSSLYGFYVTDPLMEKGGIKKTLYLADYLTIADIDGDSQKDLIFNYCPYDDICVLKAWLKKNKQYQEAFSSRGIITNWDNIDEEQVKVNIFGPGCCDAPAYNEMLTISIKDSFKIKEKTTISFKTTIDSLYHQKSLIYLSDSTCAYNKPKSQLLSAGKITEIPCIYLDEGCYGIIGEQIDTLTNTKFTSIIGTSKIPSWSNFDIFWIPQLTIHH